MSQYSLPGCVFSLQAVQQARRFFSALVLAAPPTPPLPTNLRAHRASNFKMFLSGSILVAEASLPKQQIPVHVVPT